MFKDVFEAGNDPAMSRYLALKRDLNLNYLRLTGETSLVGPYGFPSLATPPKVVIDYLALYSRPSEYAKTPWTALCFYEYDRVFDGPKGLWHAIYHDDKKLLDYYKKRFEKVDVAISPDYSMIGDAPEAFNIFNVLRARIVSLWLTLECGKIVVPSVTYASEGSFEYMLDGLERCQVVAFSAKGSLRNAEQRVLFEKAIEFTVGKLDVLKQIIVYNVARSDNDINSLFSCALSKGIEVVIPDNLLKRRNSL